MSFHSVNPTFQIGETTITLTFPPPPPDVSHDWYPDVVFNIRTQQFEPIEHGQRRFEVAEYTFEQRDGRNVMTIVSPNGQVRVFGEPRPVRPRIDWRQEGF